MGKRNIPPTFTVLNDAPDYLESDVNRFSDIVAEDPRLAVRVLSGFVDPFDLLVCLGGEGGDHSKDGRIIAAAGRLVACGYYGYVEADPATQTAIDETVAAMQQVELRPLPPDSVGVVALRVFASQVRNYMPG